MKVLDASIDLRRAGETRRLTCRTDVESDGSVETLNLVLWLLPLEKRELGCAALLDPLAVVGDVDDAAIGINIEGLVGQIGLHVLAEVVVHAGAIDRQSLHGGDLASPAHRLQRIVGEL